VTELPTIKTSAHDALLDVTYDVMAYRKITKAELMQAIAIYNGQRKRKPKKGSRITIVTIIGFNDS